jgi:homoserine kinase type II
MSSYGAREIGNMSYDARSEFEELINQYDLGGVSSVRKTQGGAVNENWIVRTTTGSVVVRMVSKSRTLDDIRFEHSFIRALARDAYPYRLPRPLRTRAGRSVVAKNGRYVWLYPYIEGSNSRPRGNTIIPQMAHALATAHKAARCFSLRRRNANPVALEHPWLLHNLRRLHLKLARAQEETYRFFRAHVQECIGILEKFSCTRYSELPRLPIHGDLCRDNLIFSGERLRGVIDFGHCCSDTAIRDVTIALGYECTKDGCRLDLQTARRFLEIYHEISPLTVEETDLIPAIAIAESADLFRWKIFEFLTGRANAPPISELERLLKALRWYNLHRKDIAGALRI